MPFELMRIKKREPSLIEHEEDSQDSQAPSRVMDQLEQPSTALTLLEPKSLPSPKMEEKKFTSAAARKYGGNPHAKAGLIFKSKLYAVVKKRGYTALAEKLYDCALAGEAWAMKELNDRLFGKAQQSISISEKPQALLELEEIIVTHAATTEDQEDDQIASEAMAVLQL